MESERKATRTIYILSLLIECVLTRPGCAELGHKEQRQFGKSWEPPFPKYISIQMSSGTTLRSFSQNFPPPLNFLTSIFFSSQALTSYRLQHSLTFIDHAFDTISHDLFSLCVNNIRSLCSDGIARFRNSSQQCPGGPEP